MTAPDGRSRQGVWLRAILAALVLGAAVGAAVVLVWHFDVNVAAGAAAVVTALAGLAGGLRGWLGARAGDDHAARRKASRAFAVSATAVAVLAGATVWWVHGHQASPERPCPSATGTLRILAGHSLYGDQALGMILDEVQAASGVTIQLGDQEGTLAAAEKILDTDLTADYDAVWLPSNQYLLLDPRATQKVDAPGVAIARSPVVLGLRHEVAVELGWDTHRPSWRDIAEAANAGKFTYGMTNPAISNSGLSALIAADTALAGDADALRRFFQGEVITSGSTGNLTDQYRRRAETGQPVQGLISYESEILNLNPSLPAADRLDLIYPSDGTLVADFPLTLLKPAPDEVRQRFDAVTCRLTSKDVQARIAGTNRRVVGADAPMPAGVDPATLTTLPFPQDLAAVNALLYDFRDKLRKPSRTLYVLDVSGSMCWPRSGGTDGDPCAPLGSRRIDDMVSALEGLAGANANVTFTDQVSEFSRGEQVVLMPFSDRVNDVMNIDIAQDLAAGQSRIRSEAEGLAPQGATYLYEALEQAYTLAGSLIAGDPTRITSIVLLTDGEANGDKKFADFRTFYEGLGGTPAGAVRTFTIALGEANLAELSQVAQLTTGLAYDSQRDSLATIFFQIRGYV